MSDNSYKAIIELLAMIITMIIGLLIAFPIMWCWNYTMTDIFMLPEITWGKAWCLYFITSLLIKSPLYNIKR